MRFIDRDGDVWAGDLGGRLKAAGEKPDTYAYRWFAPEMWYSSVETLCGPLKPVNPYADDTTRSAIRAELAIVLTELAEEADRDARNSYDVQADIGYAVSALLDTKARELRDEVGM